VAEGRPDVLVGTGVAAQILDVSDDTVLKFAADGLLPVAALTPAGHRRFALADVEAAARRRDEGCRG
jgi:DNA-binding transcriptional MerR regulator